MSSSLCPEKTNALQHLKLLTTRTTPTVEVPAQENADTEIPEALANISVN